MPHCLSETWDHLRKMKHDDITNMRLERFGEGNYGTPCEGYTPVRLRSHLSWLAVSFKFMVMVYATSCHTRPENGNVCTQHLPSQVPVDKSPPVFPGGKF